MKKKSIGSVELKKKRQLVKHKSVHNSKYLACPMAMLPESAQLKRFKYIDNTRVHQSVYILTHTRTDIQTIHDDRSLTYTCH